MKLGFDPTYFWQVGGVFIKLEALWIADRLTISFALEPWEFRPFFKEVFVGTLQIFNLALQDLTISFLEPLSFCLMFQSSCSTFQFVIANPFASFLISNLPQRQCPVPNKASVPELDSQSLLLFSSGVEAITEGFADDHMSTWASGVYSRTGVLSTSSLKVWSDRYLFGISLSWSLLVVFQCEKPRQLPGPVVMFSSRLDCTFLDTVQHSLQDHLIFVRAGH